MYNLERSFIHAFIIHLFIHLYIFYLCISQIFVFYIPGSVLKAGETKQNKNRKMDIAQASYDL